MTCTVVSTAVSQASPPALIEFRFSCADLHSASTGQPSTIVWFTRIFLPILEETDEEPTETELLKEDHDER